MSYSSTKASGSVNFNSLLNRFNIHMQPFDIKRCDERTLYIPITIEKENDKSDCDLIYLIDKKDLYGAISLNERYDKARHFFVKHFNYELLYDDEQHIAKIVSSSPQFKNYLQSYATVYPKYVQSIFSN